MNVFLTTPLSSNRVVFELKGKLRATYFIFRDFSSIVQSRQEISVA